MQEIIIHNWDELQRAVFDDVWDEKIMRYRDNRIYRGMADQSWNLIPSLNRVCGHDLSLETQVFRSFRKYGRCCASWWIRGATSSPWACWKRSFRILIR